MLDDYAARILARQLHVIEDDGTIRGLVVLIPEAAAMLLDNVAVDPRFKGQGFGRVLIEFAEESARAAGYTQIRLYTHVAMTENIALYGRIGYVEAYRAEENGLARVYMVKTLA
jgi:ribosomal protein S18 acetylase RimI-like enzyme